jgi:hypothetical protein
MPEEDFLESSRTADGYFAKMRELIARPAALDRIARAFRWYSLFVLGGTIDVTDVIPHGSFMGLPEYKRPMEAAAIVDTVLGRRQIWDIAVERLHAAQRPDSHKNELEELRRQLRRIVHFLMTGDQRAADLPLVIGETAEPSSRARVVWVSGTTVRYSDGNGACTRTSPMVARLVPLCAETDTLSLASGGFSHRNATVAENG